MFNFLKKGSQKNSSCCNIQIEEIKEETSLKEETKPCCNEDEAQECCSNN